MRNTHINAKLLNLNNKTFMRKFIYTMALLLVATLSLTVSVQAQEQLLDDFEEKVTEFTLDNGYTFLVIERHRAPVVSMVSFVNVGGANEPVGHTGIAHIFEHMAFKGTPKIGTTNWEKEKVLLQKTDDAYQTWLAEKYSPQVDSTKLAALWDQFKKNQEQAGQYVDNNEFSEIINRNGGVGMNAGTSYDQTVFFYSLPENRLELWFALESARFENPVFREFYKEKNVIREERRMRTESTPVGRLLEEFLAVAYTAHPYGRSLVGWPSDIIATTMDDTREFYNSYYVPNNITFAIAGDVNPDQVKEWAKAYFGDVPAAPAPPPVYTLEPEQRGARKLTLVGNSQPVFLMGYHTVPSNHPDAEALQLLGSVLSGGRTSILYKKMVEAEQSALQVVALNGYPGTKFETMFLTLAIPNRGVSLDSIRTSILEEIEKIKNGQIPKEALDRARTQARANLIRSLDSNAGLARALAAAEAQKGDWRAVFTRIQDLQKVTVEDIQRVANEYLVKSNRTIGVIKNEANIKEASNEND